MTLTLAVLSSALVSALIIWLWTTRRQTVLVERLRAREEEVARIGAELSALQTRALQLDQARSQLETTLAGERAGAAEKIKTLTEAHERVTNEFKALSADALKSNNTAFLELAKATASSD